MKKFEFVILFTLLLACDSAKVFEENIALENHIWKLENQPKFQTKLQTRLTK